ncbi:AraC family transcriptional regulator [Mucilaginibacter sp. OK283]|jgi:AraC-like DNA-binding protein|uniref:helix-turn-helix domain-containing protein n=1 Tax=Mucilaginibacter sp. OK283 TaxID=1881049 RepID=UPI0008BE98E5|nr:AraC family transcriptional regulator [Mucilaginibacter sp. OK283]SEP38291.1 AraC-type DNA-binding protein [Mucilaginibacter sp. OK283]
MEANAELPGILISCYYHKTVKGENIIRHHAFAYQLSGKLIVRGEQETVIFEPGDFRFNVRNQLARFIKQPEQGEAFRSLSLQFDEEVLREFAAEHRLVPENKPNTPPSFKLKKHPLLQNFMNALQQSLPYFEAGNRELVKLKLKEALVILLKVQPELKDLLFDFDPPGKINLKAFMEQNFRYNLSIARLAFLCGRSISGFKRDFFNAYNTTPAKWLQAKRLEEAYYLLKQKQIRPTDVCTEVGLENLSHFSFIFKKHFGCTPAQIFKS